MRYAILSNDKFYAMSDARYSEFLRTFAEKGAAAALAFASETAATAGTGIKEHEGEFSDLRKLSQKSAHEAIAADMRAAQEAKATKEKAAAEKKIAELQAKLQALQAQS